MFIPAWNTRDVYVSDGNGGYCTHQLGLGIIWTLEVEEPWEGNSACGDDIFDPSSLLWGRTSCDTYPDWDSCPEKSWLGLLAVVSLATFFTLMNFFAMSHKLCCDSKMQYFNAENQTFSKGNFFLSPKTALFYCILSMVFSGCALAIWFAHMQEEYQSVDFSAADEFAQAQGAICYGFEMKPRTECLELDSQFSSLECYIGKCIDDSPVASSTDLSAGSTEECSAQCGDKGVGEYSFNGDCVSVIGLIINAFFMFFSAQALQKGDEFDL